MTKAYNPGRGFRMSSPYGQRIDPITGLPGEFHSGQDFAASAGTHIPAATFGNVVYSGFNAELGNTVIVKNDTGDYSLYGHMLDGNQVPLGRRIWPGDTIGLVGSTGARTTGNHLHYSVIEGHAGSVIDNAKAPHTSGPIGLRLKDTTLDPAKYKNYDLPPLRHLDETRRAVQILAGTNANAMTGAPPPDHQDSFDNRFGNWGSSSAGLAPAAPTDPESFNDRFGNWGSAPAGESSIPSSPLLLEMQRHRNSSASDGAVPALAQGTAPSLPVPAALDLPGSATAAPDSKPVRYLGRRLAGQPPTPVLNVDPQMAPPISADASDFSGGLPGRLAALMGISSQNSSPALPAPPDDELDNPYRNAPAWLLPERR